MKALATLALLSLTALAAHGSDWPHVRGPNLDGRGPGPGLLEDGAPALEVAWKIPLGSGYSGMAAEDGKVVTLFTAGPSDWIAAFSLETGKELWRHGLGPKNPGRDGSTDGPASSPVLGEGFVYTLTPFGTLLALGLEDGKVRWQKALTDEFGAEKPHFGFGTTPVLEDGVLIVQIGAPKGHSLAGFDAETGALRWATREDPVAYQSPTVIPLAGRRQVVAISETALGGFDPATGESLWLLPLEEGARVDSANPAPAGEDRLLVFIGGEAAVFEVSKAEDAFAAKELYRSKALGGNYAPPVFHEGYLYGFRGRILTCMEAATGERKWRSREPGGDGLLLAEDRLVIFGAQGNVVVAEADPEGYRELARIQALAGSSLTWPSLAGGRILVRNLEEMAAVALVPGTPAPASSVASQSGQDASDSADHAFGRWLEATRRSENPKERVEELFEKHPTFPIVEGPWVHFLFQGEAEDVALFGSVLPDGGSLPLHRLGGTNLFYRTLHLEPGGRWEYGFQTDFSNRQPDPKNPRTVTAIGGRGSISEFFTEGYEMAAHVEEPQEPRGMRESFKLSSKILGEDKEIEIWLPPGYSPQPAEASSSYPLLIVSNGKSWLEAGSLAHSLENLVGRTVSPMVVAFVPATGQWWLESGGSRTGDYVRMLTEELVPQLRKRYRVSDKASSTALWGTRYFGLTSAYGALRFPEVFGKVVVQSPNLGLGAKGDLEELIRARQGSSVSIYLDWDRYAERNIDRGIDTKKEAEELAALLSSHDYRWSGGEVFDSAGWGGWRNRTHRILAALFPNSAP